MKSRYLRILPLSLASALLFSYQSLAATEPTTASPTTNEPRLIVEGVECRGNESIPCDFIRRSLNLRANEAIDEDAVQSAQLRLSALTNFESVRVYLQKGTERGKALLIVEVVEASPIVKDFTLGLQHISWESADNAYGNYRMPDELSETLTGRIGHLNLFGRQKIGEVTVAGYHNGYDNVDYSNLSVRLTYIDPHLLAVDRLFMSVSGQYTAAQLTADANVQDIYDPISDSYFQTGVHQYATSRGWTSRLSVGYKLWQYSYAFASLEHTGTFKDTQRIEYDDARLEDSYFSDSHAGGHRFNLWRLGYGWDSEDDSYFPTQGSRLSAVVSYRSIDTTKCSICHEIDWRLAYKYNWMMGRNSVWSINLGGEPESGNDRLRPQDAADRGLAVTYARLLPTSDTSSGIRRGRWYVQLGAGPFALSRDARLTRHFNSGRIALGLRFENKVLGIVNLYASGERFFARSGQ